MLLPSTQVPDGNLVVWINSIVDVFLRSQEDRAPLSRQTIRPCYPYRSNTYPTTAWTTNAAATAHLVDLSMASGSFQDRGRTRGSVAGVRMDGMVNCEYFFQLNHATATPKVLRTKAIDRDAYPNDPDMTITAGLTTNAKISDATTTVYCVPVDFW